MKAVVLASGGVDSTVTAAVARRDGCQLYFLTIGAYASYWFTLQQESMHVTPRSYIALCANDPYSNTSSRIWPSGWYTPSPSASGR